MRLGRGRRTLQGLEFGLQAQGQSAGGQSMIRVLEPISRLPMLPTSSPSSYPRGNMACYLLLALSVSALFCPPFRDPSGHLLWPSLGRAPPSSSSNQLQRLFLSLEGRSRRPSTSLLRDARMPRCVTSFVVFCAIPHSLRAGGENK
jgi:hypothetical protein